MAAGKAWAGLLAAAALLAVAATGCATGDDGDPHPGDRLDFPVAVTAHPDGSVVWVTSGNFDLAYRGGAVLAIDTLNNRFIEDAAFEVAGFPGKLHILQREGEAVAGYILSRDADALFHVKFGAGRAGSDSPVSVSCPGGRGGEGRILRCPTEDAIERADVTDDDGQQAELVVGPDPFAAIVRPARSAGEPDLLLTGAMVDGTLSSFELADDGTPELVGNLDLLNGLFALTENHSNGRIYTASKTNNVFQVLGVQVPDPDTQSSSTNPWLRVIDALSVPEALARDRARGIAVSADGTRLYASYRSPDSLVVVDVSEGVDGDPEDRVLAKIPLSEDPGDIVVVRDASGRELVYVACFGDDVIEVVDPLHGQVIDLIRTGSGPFGLAYVDAPDLGLKRLYVTNFNDHSVGVIELDPSSAFYHQLVAEVR